VESLTTQGRDIVQRATGRPVRLRGVNLSGLEYDAQHAGITRDAVQAIAAWGANIIRLPFNQDWVFHLPGYEERLDQVIGWAAEAGLYTLLDLQWLNFALPYGASNHVPPLPIPESIDLWRRLARRYRARPEVLYDIFNEPHDPLPDDPYPMVDPAGQVLDGAWVDHPRWRRWAEPLVDAIRAEHPGALVFVSGIDWGYDLRGFPLDREHIVYSTHIYRPRGQAWTECFGALALTHPVFAGEWGFDEAEHAAWGRDVLDFLHQRGLGWTAWSWNDYPLLQSGGLPTTFGRLVKEALAGD
jgi:endoglucanase